MAQTGGGTSVASQSRSPKTCNHWLHAQVELWRVFVIFWLLPGVNAWAGAGEPVQLTIDGDRITAGDLARVIPAWEQVDSATKLGYAPRPGLQRKVKPWQILRWAGPLGLHLKSGDLPSAVVVSRRMRSLQADEVVELLTKSISSRYQVEPKQVQVRLDEFGGLSVPSNAVDFELVRSVSRFNQPALIPLQWRDPEGQTGRIMVRASISVLSVHAVARKAIPAKTHLEREDFVFEEGPLPGPPEDFLLRPSDVEGKELKHPMRAGRVLEKRMLVKPAAIRRGDLIQLQVRLGAIQLRVPARAEQPGSVGDVITCRNLESGRRVTATVIDTQFAEVILRP